MSYLSRMDYMLKSSSIVSSVCTTYLLEREKATVLVTAAQVLVKEGALDQLNGTSH